jgi:membrane protease YdiL (CAAX protease family)
MRTDLPAPRDAPIAPPARPARRSSWSWWEAVLVYLLATLVSSSLAAPILSSVKPEKLGEAVADVAFAAVNVLILVLWLSRRHPGWRRAIGFPRNWLREAEWGIGFGLLLYPGIVFGAGLVLNLFLDQASGQNVTTPQQVPSHLPALGVALTVAYALVVAPIHEELFFRGILFRSLRDRYGFGVGALASGVVFGLVHYVPAPFVDSLLLMSTMVFTGFALAFFYEWRGNIVASMIAHAAFNSIGLVLIYVLH